MRSLLLSAALLATTAAAPAPEATVAALMKSASYRSAVTALDTGYDRVVADTVMLTEIPAPPFKEVTRGKAYKRLMEEAGIKSVEIDPEGNVLALRPGTGGGSLVVIAAHLDTVFPEGTPIKVKREGTRLSAPGIGDDTRSLATLLGYVRAMDAGKVRTRADILFVGNVGEEGPGDLRGVRYLFNKSPYKGRISAFISMDGSDPARIVNGGTGSKRYKAIFTGPGGHSYGAFGIVNPMAAMGRAVAELYKVEVPLHPKTTYSASVAGGGTSVNSIPNLATMEFDTRSEDPGELARLDAKLLSILNESVAEENRARSTRNGVVKVEPKVIGERPAGRTDPNSAIVRLARASIAANGFTPGLETSSTDSNVPMSLGIPAITIGSGGEAGRAHALDEWIDVAHGPSVKGAQAGLTTLLALAGVVTP